MSLNTHNNTDVIIADTSCFIVLSKIDEIQILKQLFGRVVTTPEVANEFGEPLPSWVMVSQVNNNNLKKSLTMQLDLGEASTLALALENSNSLLILDDFKARQIAMRLGISITGTLGIIIQAKNLGIIDTVKPLLEKIQLTNFRLSNTLIAQALMIANE